MIVVTTEMMKVAGPMFTQAIRERRPLEEALKNAFSAALHTLDQQAERKMEVDPRIQMLIDQNQSLKRTADIERSVAEASYMAELKARQEELTTLKSTSSEKIDMLNRIILEKDEVITCQFNKNEVLSKEIEVLRTEVTDAYQENDRLLGEYKKLRSFNAFTTAPARIGKTNYRKGTPSSVVIAAAYRNFLELAEESVESTNQMGIPPDKSLVPSKEFLAFMAEVRYICAYGPYSQIMDKLRKAGQALDDALSASI